MNKTEDPRFPVSQMESISSIAILHPRRSAPQYPDPRNLSHPPQANSVAEPSQYFVAALLFPSPPFAVVTHRTREPPQDGCDPEPLQSNSKGYTTDKAGCLHFQLSHPLPAPAGAFFMRCRVPQPSLEHLTSNFHAWAVSRSKTKRLFSGISQPSLSPAAGPSWIKSGCAHCVRERGGSRAVPSLPRRGASEQLVNSTAQHRGQQGELRRAGHGGAGLPFVNSLL